MYEVFSAAMKELDDGSSIEVWPDHGWWKLTVDNGAITEIGSDYVEEDETE